MANDLWFKIRTFFDGKGITDAESALDSLEAKTNATSAKVKEVGREAVAAHETPEEWHARQMGKWKAESVAIEEKADAESAAKSATAEAAEATTTAAGRAAAGVGGWVSSLGLLRIASLAVAGVVGGVLVGAVSGVVGWLGKLAAATPECQAGIDATKTSLANLDDECNRAARPLAEITGRVAGDAFQGFAKGAQGAADILRGLNDQTSDHARAANEAEDAVEALGAAIYNLGTRVINTSSEIATISKDLGDYEKGINSAATATQKLADAKASQKLANVDLAAANGTITPEEAAQQKLAITGAAKQENAAIAINGLEQTATIQHAAAEKQAQLDTSTGVQIDAAKGKVAAAEAQVAALRYSMEDTRRRIGAASVNDPAVAAANQRDNAEKDRDPTVVAARGKLEKEKTFLAELEAQQKKNTAAATETANAHAATLADLDAQRTAAAALATQQEANRKKLTAEQTEQADKEKREKEERARREQEEADRKQSVRDRQRAAFDLENQQEVLRAQGRDKEAANLGEIVRLNERNAELVKAGIITAEEAAASAAALRSAQAKQDEKTSKLISEPVSEGAGNHARHIGTDGIEIGKGSHDDPLYAEHRIGQSEGPQRLFDSAHQFPGGGQGEGAPGVAVKDAGTGKASQAPDVQAASAAAKQTAESLGHLVKEIQGMATSAQKTDAVVSQAATAISNALSNMQRTISSLASRISAQRPTS